MKRSEAREKVFRTLFQMEFYEDYAELVPRMLEDEGLMKDGAPRGVQGQYAYSTIFGILEKREEVDGLIREHLKGWALDRLGYHVRALLRLGVYELCYNPEIPNITAIDETVTLSHAYCDEKDAQFINGLLNNLLKSGLGLNAAANTIDPESR